MGAHPHSLHGPVARIAALDIGTVTSRLLVGDTDGRAVSVVERAYEVTNLGEGVDATGRLSVAALERVAGAIDSFLVLRDACSTLELPVEKTVVVTTSAARDAENAQEFAAMMAERGLHLSVLTGQEEAALTFLGATSPLDPGAPVCVMDVGGGSTEISFGRAGEAVRASHSFDIGCRRATERFFRTDPPTAEERAKAAAWMRAEFSAWDGARGEGSGPSQLIAVAGTATSAISMEKRLAVYDPEQVQGAHLAKGQLDGLVERLASMTEAERERVVGLDPRRAPVIVAGLSILSVAMEVFGFSDFMASESDILQGIILDAVR